MSQHLMKLSLSYRLFFGFTVVCLLLLSITFSTILSEGIGKVIGGEAIVINLPKDYYLFFLVSGFALGIAAYQMVLFWCTRTKIYILFAVALCFYVIQICHLAGIWNLSCCSTESISLVLETLNLTLFALFIKQFLMEFVDFKHLHPHIALAIDSYIFFGGMLILFFIVYPHPFFYKIQSVLIIVATLTGPLTIRYWYPTIKHLKAFNYIQMMFCLLNTYFFSQKLFFGNQELPLFFYVICLLISSALFIAFSSLITQRITLDREQRDMAQHTAIRSLEKYHLLYQNAVTGLFTVDEAGYLKNSNSALKKLLGLPLSDTSSTAPLRLPSYFLDPENNWGKVLRRLALHGPVENMEIKGNQNVWYSLTAQRFGEVGSSQIEGSLTDISRRKHQEIQLDYLARHDALTLLHNRNEFESFLQDALHSASFHTLLFIDLDNFKIINDLCGHRAGDQCLQELAVLLKMHIGKQDMLARLGGDEFGIVFWDQDLASGKIKAQSIRIALDNHFFHWQQRVFKTTVSIGVVAINEHINCGAEALSLADAACYQAKAAGRNHVTVHEPVKLEALQHQSRIAMASLVTQAIKHDQLLLYYQPIIAFDEHAVAVCHIEVWVRMTKNMKQLLARSFLPAAQYYNLVADLDRWVFNAVCIRLSAIDQPRIDLVNINISPQTLNDAQFFEFVQQRIGDFAVIPHRICFEINEHSMLSNFIQGLANIHKLRELGFRFALDNFGTGFAAIEQIKRLPVDFVKIDGQFIHNLSQDTTNKMLVQAVAEISHSLGKQVIAGCVEDEETALLLKSYHIDFVQGNYYGVPELLEEQGLQPLKG